MLWLLAVTVSCLCFFTVRSSTFVPLRDGSDLTYLFVLAPGSQVLAVCAIVVMTLAAVFRAINRLALRGDAGSIREARAGRWMSPLIGLSAIVLGVIPAVPGIGIHGAPLAYFFFDLRWWWFIVLTGWTLARGEALVGRPLTRRLAAVAAWSPAARLLLVDVVLFTAVTGWALATTPHLRFIGALHGDEPKYVRYCEIWYQGGGLDISTKALFADEPLDASPRLTGPITRLTAAIGEETGAMITDLRQFAADPAGFRWNRAKGGGGFVAGKHGGIYEIYQPGLSVILFPGYFIDRYLLGLHPGYQGEFPSDLVMTNLTMLVIYGLCAVALFRLLRHALQSEALASLWAALGIMTMPMTAFAFQLYPELPALLVILIVTNFIFFHAPGSAPLAAAAAGAASGALGWFHPRFFLLSLCLAGAGLLRTRGKAQRALSVCFVLAVVSVLAFEYRVTGSWLPTARWDAANPAGTLNPVALPTNILGYMFHRTWGLLPHSLVLLGVLPGLVVLARRRPAAAIAVIVFGAALLIPAAGHSLSAAAGTPGRLVLAIVPLFIAPVALLVRRFWSSRAIRSTTVLLVVLSLDAAFSYNWTHKKHLGPIRGLSTSGWKPNLAFPDVHAALGDSWNPSSAVLIVFIGALVVFALLAFVRDRSRVQPRTTLPVRFSWIVPLAVVSICVIVSTATTAAFGRWHHTDYLLEDRDALRVAARALVEHSRCRVCFTSRNGSFDWTRLNPNTADAMTVHVVPQGQSITLSVRLDGSDNTIRFARTHVDFGDGIEIPWSGIVDERHFEHTYSRPGSYGLVAWLQLRDGRTRLVRRTVRIDDPQSQ
jgi:hypothetical protein